MTLFKIDVLTHCKDVPECKFAHQVESRSARELEADVHLTTLHAALRTVLPQRVVKGKEQITVICSFAEAPPKLALAAVEAAGGIVAVGDGQANVEAQKAAEADWRPFVMRMDAARLSTILAAVIEALGQELSDRESLPLTSDGLRTYEARVAARTTPQTLRDNERTFWLDALRLGAFTGETIRRAAGGTWTYQPMHQASLPLALTTTYRGQELGVTPFGRAILYLESANAAVQPSQFAALVLDVPSSSQMQGLTPKTSWLRRIFSGGQASPPASAQASSNVLSPLQFTFEFAKRLREHSPDQPVRIVDDLNLDLAGGSLKVDIMHLRNAYKRYFAYPETIGTIVDDFAKTSQAARDAPDFTASRLVATIKPAKFLADIAGMGRSVQMPLHEPLCHLHLVYQFDMPHGIMAPDRGAVDNLGLSPDELQATALANLRRIFDAPMFVMSHRHYSMGGQGDAQYYVSSAILLDEYWDKAREPFATLGLKGDYVVFVPCRSWLIVTGSEEPQGLVDSRKLAMLNYSQDPHPVSPVALIRRNGRWEMLPDQPWEVA